RTLGACPSVFCLLGSYCDHRDLLSFPTRRSSDLGRQGGQIIVRDITERRQAEQAVRERQAEVRRSRERLEALSQRLLKVQENERRLIARELHDQIDRKSVV